MAVKIMDAGSVLREASSLKVQDGGTLRRILRVKVMDDTSTLRTVATFVAPLSVSLAVSMAYYPVAYGPDAQPIEYDAVASLSATPAGGLGPYTYSWALLSGTGWTLAASTTATTTATGDADFVTAAVVRVTVTDATGQTATADISI